MAYGARRRPSDGIHKAVEGDTISSIAASYGFTDWEEKVWNAGENANLKQERENPNELVPGDEVFIPELEEKQEARPTDEWHDFHVVRNKRHLRLKLQNENGEPLANKTYQITPDDSFRGTYVQQKQTTDADGMIDEEIPHTLLEAVLTVEEENLRTRLLIGHLQPIPKGEPVSAPALDAGGALGGLGGGLVDAAGGVIGSVTNITSAAGGSASAGLSLGGDGISLGGGASADGVLSMGAKVAMAAATAVAGPSGGAIAALLGDGAFGDDEDPSIHPAAQRLVSMGFKPGKPKDERTAQFSAALMSFQTWCKEKGTMPEGAGGMLGGLTAPGGLLGGGGGVLGSIAGAVAGPALAAVGLTGQLDDETIEALEETHGC